MMLDNDNDNANNHDDYDDYTDDEDDDAFVAVTFLKCQFRQRGHVLLLLLWELG